MGKRHLTSRQLKQLKHLQAKRLERAERLQERAPETHNTALSPEQPGLLIAHYGTTLIVESQAGALFRCRLRQNLGTLVTGDQVIWQAIDENTGVVVAGLPRRSVITRFNKQGAKPFVANVEQMLILIALSPLPHPTTLDRYLTLAESFKIRPLIAINKMDLPLNEDSIALIKQLNYYESLGYPLFKLSISAQQGLNELKSLLLNNTTIVVGQSGVGKSSLLNHLIPNRLIRTQALSEKHKLGQQTTTATTLYHLPEGGDILDSPGIHQFNLHHFSSTAILEGFREFRPFLGHCKYRNCEHEHEPGCALLTATKAGKIAPFRLENYHRIIHDEEQ